MPRSRTPTLWASPARSTLVVTSDANSSAVARSPGWSSSILRAKPRIAFAVSNLGSTSARCQHNMDVRRQSRRLFSKLCSRLRTSRLNGRTSFRGSSNKPKQRHNLARSVEGRVAARCPPSATLPSTRIGFRHPYLPSTKARNVDSSRRRSPRPRRSTGFGKDFATGSVVFTLYMRQSS